MPRRDEPVTGPSPSRGRCRCGHLAVHHLVVVPVAASASFRLASTGPCVLCGEATCNQFTPGASER